METEIINNTISGSVQYAANEFQKKLISGLKSTKGVDLEILSAPFIGTYPKEYKKIFFKGNETKSTINIKYVSFLNIWGIRNLSRKKSIIKELSGFIETNDKDKVIMVYSPHTPFLEAAVYAKRKDPSIHICLVVPDMPQYINLHERQSIIYTNFKKIDFKLFYKSLALVDSFVLLTEAMKKKLNVGNRPYTIVEGMVNSQNNEVVCEYDDIATSNIKKIVYTGTLNKKFGVLNLIKAFYNLNMSDVILQICGRGDSEEIIKEYATRDNRIKYLGQLSHKEATELQHNATLLINPRQNNEEFTKYSFPSKNMEYLLTGRPVMAYKLDGIPNEYDAFFYYIEDNRLETFTKALEKVLSLPEEKRVEFGKKGRNFVLEEKNQKASVEKVIDMIQVSRSVDEYV